MNTNPARIATKPSIQKIASQSAGDSFFFKRYLRYGYGHLDDVRRAAMGAGIVLQTGVRHRESALRTMECRNHLVCCFCRSPFELKRTAIIRWPLWSTLKSAGTIGELQAGHFAENVGSVTIIISWPQCLHLKGTFMRLRRYYHNSTRRQ
jgi:hypothetical protein